MNSTTPRLKSSSETFSFSKIEKKTALNTYGDECRHAFEHTLGWLRQWACSRSFGLGTRLPWDPSYLVSREGEKKEIFFFVFSSRDFFSLTLPLFSLSLSLSLSLF